MQEVTRFSEFKLTACTFSVIQFFSQNSMLFQVLGWQKLSISTFDYVLL